MSQKRLYISHKSSKLSGFCELFPRVFRYPINKISNSINVMYPPLLELLRTHYSWKWLRRDVMAGLTVSIVAIPMALALSIAMGVSPERVIWSAVLAGFIGSFFGGSRFQISGPTAVFILIIIQTIQEYSYEGLALATCIAGLLVILFGLSGLGRVINYIPYPVIRGFLTGVGLFMVVTQVKDLCGLPIKEMPDEIWKMAQVYSHSFRSISYASLCLAVITLGLVLLIQKKHPKYPAFLIATAISTGLAHLFSFSVLTVGSAFPHLSMDIPSIGLSFYSLEEIIKILPTASALAFLGSIEALLSASLGDSMTGTRHDTNKELIAQGLANLATGFCGGIPVTSAMGRTLINIRSGAKSQVAGIVQSFFLFIFLFFFKNVIEIVPLCVLSALLLISASRMIAWQHLKQFFKGPWSDLLIFFVTLTLTLLIDLVIAVQVGVSLSMLFFVMRFIQQSEKHLRKTLLQDEPIQVPDHVKILHLDGPFFFGVTSTVEDLLLSMDDKAKILDMRTVPFIDATGLHVIQNMLEKHPHTRFVSKHRSVTRMLQQIGIQPIFVSLEEAIESVPIPCKDV